MPYIHFLITTTLILGILLVFGGMPWAIVSLIAMLAFLKDLPGPRTLFLLLAPSFIWLGLSCMTENRQYFFPFTMFLSTQAALQLVIHSRWASVLGGVSVIGAFTMVRLLQSVTTPVLLLELAVAGTILSVSLTADRFTSHSLTSRLIIATWASLMAVGGLAL